MSHVHHGDGPPIVLIADDEAAISALVAEIVEGAGFTSTTAIHGRQALEFAREQWPDLLITDLMMPYMTGAELIAALRVHATEHAKVPPPVIIMTAAGVALAQSAGADVVLRKPFDLDRLEALVHHFLDTITP